ncbi:hypothetical protein [Altererythrobacter sp. B11]|uniref:hypothetical protein n=1 Tax=Altererythrobacter sp. B11 TaxID=2060312 RepID=UPI0011AE1E36|nr:hypothetical protein [Altererythrobacter sp. B11]
MPAVAGEQQTEGEKRHSILKPELQTGTAFRAKPREVEDPAVVNRMSKAVANCVNGREAGMVRSFLSVSDPVDTDREAADFRWSRFMDVLEGCMKTRWNEMPNDPRRTTLGMAFSDSRLRALLEEEVYLAQNDTAPEAVAGQPFQTKRFYVSSDENLARAQGLADFADCLAHRDPKTADALLRTEPGSSAERQAAKALAPSLGACLAKDQTIEFTASSIRALAADGLWAWTTLGPATAE